MNAKLFGIVFFLSLLGINICYAQGCPAGIPSGAPGCVPPDVYNSQFNKEPQVKIIRQKWKDRWGAIAADGVAGSLGFVTGFASKRTAESAAMKECKAGGGKRCTLDLSFRNGCAVFMLGSKMSYTASAGDLASAENYGMKLCNVSDSGCRVYKSACSMAESKYPRN